MPPALTQKMMGLPRWAWLLIISSGILVGLYLRRRNAAQQAAADTGLPDDTFGGGSTLDGTNDPGLAGVGLAANPAGSVVPVQSPTIPEGYPQAFTDLTGVVSALGGAIVQGRTDQAAVAASVAPNAVDNGAGTDGAATASPTAPTGGGPPSSQAGTKTGAPSTARLLAELRKPHSPAHRAHVLAILKSRNVKVPASAKPPHPKKKHHKKPKKAKKHTTRRRRRGHHH